MAGAVWPVRTSFAMTWTEIAALLERTKVAVVVVGAVEQHGPHLPMGTDTIIPLVAVERALERTRPAGVDALICEPIPFGMSQHHLPYPGSIALRSETLIALIYDVGRSLIDQGFDRLLLIPGHGAPEHEACCVLASLDLQQKLAASVAVANPWPVLGAWMRENPGASRSAQPHREAHSGETETSIDLAICPDLVKMELAPTSFTETAERMYKAGFKVRRGGEALPRSGLRVPYPGPKDYTLDGCGVVGDASVGRAELGEQLTDVAAEYFAGLIRQLHAE